MPHFQRRQSDFRWGVEQRLEFIEFRLFWEGKINRGDLMEQFGVSVNQASTDLNRYLGLAPENMAYDKSARTYLPSPGFKPLFLRLDSNQYLNQVRSVADEIISKGDSWIRAFPVYDSSATPTRVVDPDILRFVLKAVREEQSMQVRYQSLSRPDPRWRWIAPHALGFDGFRWHVRAFCEEEQCYKDFLLARIIEVRTMRIRDCNPAEDTAWHEQVELSIGANPELSDAQRQVIELDYGMQNGQVALRVRRALLFYTLRRLGLEREAPLHEPTAQHIVLLNRSQIESKIPSADLREAA